MRCESCGHELRIGDWPFCDTGGGHSRPLVGVSVVDDEIDGGPRWFDTLGHEDVYISTKSQWRREVAARGLENVVTHDDAYYAAQRRQYDELLRDTGQLVTQPRVR